MVVFVFCALRSNLLTLMARERRRSCNADLSRGEERKNGPGCSVLQMARIHQAVAPTKRAAQNAVVAWVFPELVETAMQAV